MSALPLDWRSTQTSKTGPSLENSRNTVFGYAPCYMFTPSCAHGARAPFTHQPTKNDGTRKNNKSVLVGKYKANQQLYNPFSSSHSRATCADISNNHHLAKLSVQADRNSDSSSSWHYSNFPTQFKLFSHQRNDCTPSHTYTQHMNQSVDNNMQMTFLMIASLKCRPTIPSTSNKWH